MNCSFVLTLLLNETTREGRCIEQDATNKENKNTIQFVYSFFEVDSNVKRNMRE